MSIHVTSDGKYKLVVGKSMKFEGYWNWSMAKIYHNETDEFISVVHRNYPGFPYCWVIGHPDGHDYLVCGEDYQGQTIIQLDTGLRRDYIPEVAEHGAGFCWIEIDYDSEDGTLTVLGCIWACPFETVVFDFSDPMDLPYKELSRSIDGDDIDE